MINPAKKFSGKKLLLLGTNLGTCDMVNYARSQGAYVFVTDNLPLEKSAAKQIADEAWQVSTSDVNNLEKLAFKNQVNGVLAGASEFNIEKALTLSERLGLPFYCTRQQWETCSNKKHFKQLCLANDVPVAKEYLIDTTNINRIKYPVIVKPVDSSSGTGIGICQNDDELLNAYNKAVSLSKTKQAIVEEFIKGDIFSAGYTIKDGEFSLTYTVDKYLNSSGETAPLPQANILPSRYTEKYLEDLNAKVINMLKSIGLTNGFLAIQGILNDEGLHFIETNYRLAGSSYYRMTSKINGINYMEMLVNHALSGKMDGYDLSLDNPRFIKYGCSLNLISKGGLVGKIIGLEEIKHKQSLIAVDKMYNVGDYIEKSGTLGQVHLRFHMVEDSIRYLKDSIQEIQDTIKVLDDKGRDMLLPPFNTDRM
jgi:carbamoylphosphate synthase large subunit